MGKMRFLVAIFAVAILAFGAYVATGEKGLPEGTPASRDVTPGVPPEPSQMLAFGDELGFFNAEAQTGDNQTRMFSRIYADINGDKSIFAFLEEDQTVYIGNYQIPDVDYFGLEYSGLDTRVADHDWCLERALVSDHPRDLALFDGDPFHLSAPDHFTAVFLHCLGVGASQLAEAALAEDTAAAEEDVLQGPNGFRSG